LYDDKILVSYLKYDEYVSTCAYFLWEKGIGIDDNDRWFQAERYIDERFLFVPKVKLLRYG
jgi:hypothetical protein